MIKTLITYKVSLYSLLLLLVGCNGDLLETVPNDRISSEIFWRTIEDAEYGVNAIYPTLDGINIVQFDGFTDMLITNRMFEENYTIQQGYGTSSSDRFYTVWSNAYVAIQRANDFLLKSADIQTNNRELLDRYTGEAKTLRAYHYIKLVALYGNVPLVTRPLTIVEGRQIGQTPAAEVWSFIMEELDAAAALLPWESRSRIGKGAALGLKARAALYAGRYDEAADAAKQIIDSRIFSLYDSYENLFQYVGEGNREVILQREYATGINTHNIYAQIAPWSQIAGSNGSAYVPSAEIVDLYETNEGKSIAESNSGYDVLNPYANRDPRLTASIFLNGVTPLPGGGVYGTTPGSTGSDAVQITLYSTSTGYNVRKYVANEDYLNPTNSRLNIILLRYAEVLLTYAEAKIELGDIDQSVYAAINEVRQRPSVVQPAIISGSSIDEMRNIVRKERTVELAFEGHRLFDLRRWRTAETEIPRVPLGITYVENGMVRQVVLDGYVRNFNPLRDYLWPIPQRERDLNTNLVQNPNW